MLIAPPPELLREHHIWNETGINKPEIGLRVEDFDFSGLPDPPKFANFRFRGHVEFINCIFPPGTVFEGATFSRRAIFQQCQFVGEAVFNSVGFEGTADFRDSHFQQSASFRNINHQRPIVFTGARFDAVFAFSNRANVGAVLECASPTIFHGPISVIGDFDRVDFSGARFEQVAEFKIHVGRYGAKFQNARFADNVSFGLSVFEGALLMEDVECLGTTSLSDSTIKGPLDCHRAKFRGKVTFSGEPGSTLPACNFTSAEFHDRSWFDGRRFLGDTSFDRAKFHRAPGFHNCELFAATYFEGSEYWDLTSGNAEMCYRSLRHCCKKIEHPAWELRFFELEMRARRLSEPEPAARTLYLLYEVTANYGRSIWRPFIWFWVIQLLFWVLYWAVENFSVHGALSCGKSISCDFDSARLNRLLNYTLAQALPFIPAIKDGGATLSVSEGGKLSRKWWQ